MKALSINQPWAWAILHGGKNIENRKWNTNFRGQFWIHAGQRYDSKGEEWIRSTFPDVSMTMPFEEDLIRGGIIGVASIIDCVQKSDSPWFFGPFGFVLQDIQPVKFVPCRGMLNFFEPKFNK